VKVVARTDEYTIYQRRDERYAVKSAERQWVNGDAKIAILVEHKLIDVAVPKPAPEPEPEASESAAEETEAVAEDASAEAEAQADDAESGGEDAAADDDAKTES